MLVNQELICDVEDRIRMEKLMLLVLLHLHLLGTLHLLLPPEL